MSIKKRLFISNILLLTSPLILTSLILITAYWTFSAMTGISLLVERDRTMHLFNINTAGALPFSPEKTTIAHDYDVFALDTGQNLLVLPSDFRIGPPAEASQSTAPRILAILFLFFLVTFVFMLNILLIRFVFGNIKKSILVLRQGVNEISSGNLSYRIQHHKGNEFDSVCTDFNFMASKLYSIVLQKQKDEDSRKELIAGISHDLRTPLATIKAYIEGLRQGIATTPQMQKRYLDTIYDNTEDIEYIINQLFLFSKIDIGEFPFKLEPVNLKEELPHLISSLSDEYAQKGLHLQIDSLQPDAPVEIDIVQFRNILQNIFNNTLKYGKKEGGCLTLTTTQTDDAITLHLTDNGDGVSEDQLAKIFDVFYREDTSRTNQGNGSGLGLAICAKIVKRFNGEIHAFNATPHGLTIAITLPLQK